MTESQLTPEILQQHPLLALGIVLLAGIFLSLLAGCIAVWTWQLTRYYRGLPFLPVDTWTPRVWGLADIILVLMLVVGGQFVAYFVAKGIGIQQAEGETSLALAALAGVSNLGVVVLATLWIGVRFRVFPSHIGFTTNVLKVGFIGLLAGLALVPIIYLGNAIVSLGMKVDYNHPLIDSVRNDSTATNFLLAVFAAAIVAPITEEFLFRGLLQGWLQSIPFRPLLDTLIGRTDGTLTDVSALQPPGSTQVPNPIAAPVDSSNPYASGSAAVTPESTEREDVYQSNVVPPIWPSVVAGVLFGLAHWGYGWSFIPLSLFGFGLGLVYRATHSIWPCVLIHFMMNGTSMVALGVAAYAQNVAPTDAPEEVAVILSWLLFVTQG
ncbi:MAG: hypothetical protein Aurels2KO_48930 [Aureliella sp.]